MKRFGVAEMRAIQGIDYAAIDDNRDPVAQAQQLIQIRRHDQDTCTRPGGVLDHAVDFLARANVDTDSRFIESEASFGRG